MTSDLTNCIYIAFGLCMLSLSKCCALGDYVADVLDSIYGRYQLMDFSSREPTVNR